ncbi:MAG TPA: DVUA0089 family protein [Phycisphaerales bacterium]|nr:DVUA0089 family protein [Phycisphaerales bacterium]
MKIALTAFVLAAAAGAANADIFFETEGNNTTGTANSLGSFTAPGQGILVDGAITPGTTGQTGAPGTAGDVDWFSFTVDANTTMVASIFAIINNNAGGASPDSQLILVNSAGAILASDDDSNVGFMSSLDTITLGAGTYFIGITGFNDLNIGGAGGVVMPDGFTGNTQVSGHTENWTYKLIIGLNIVPTPGAAALLGLGGLVAGRRRR